MIDIQKEREAFDEFFKNKFKDLHESLCCGDLVAKKYKKALWKTWQAAKSNAVPETKKFNLDEFLLMEQKLKSKGGIIKADLDRFIAYAEMVLEKAKATREPK